MERNSGAWLLVIYLFLSIYLLPMFPHGGSANELTRWATAASLVEKGTFDTAWTEPLIGPNVDTVKIEDRVYSNKAPAPAILAAPVYAMTRLFIGPPDASNIRISWFAMRFFLSTIPMLLLGLWLYARDTDEFSLATFLFASPLFIYSLLFFSHVLAAVVLYMAFRAIYDQRYILPWHCFIAGALCGIAVLSEFAAIIPTVVFIIGAYFADRRERFARLLFFILGGLPFALFLGYYNFALFGSPLSLSYAHETFSDWAQVASHGIFGIGLPSPYNLYLLLLSPSRGLLFSAPVFLLAFFEFVSSREIRTIRHKVKIAAILITIVVISGHDAAQGGWAFGPRYLILILPLLLDSFFDGEVYEISNLWQGIFFGVSLVLCTLPILTFPFAPPEFSQPYRDLWTWSLIDEHWYVPNLANAFGFTSSIWTTVPVFAAVILVVFVVVGAARRRARFTVGLLIALVIVSAYIFFPTSSTNAENEFRRATIAERFFQPSGRLDAFKHQAESAHDAAAIERIRQAEWMIADTRGYAPNDFPYLPADTLTPGPTQLIKDAAEAETDGDLVKAMSLLQTGKEQFPFAECDFATALALIYHTSLQRDEELQELESAQPQVDRTSSPACIKSQFLLGTLYRELDRTADSNRAFGAFLVNSDGTTDAELIGLRKQLGK